MSKKKHLELQSNKGDHLADSTSELEVHPRIKHGSSTAVRLPTRKGGVYLVCTLYSSHFVSEKLESNGKAQEQESRFSFDDHQTNV